MTSLLPYAPERDVYRLLQVEPTANDREIAAACRRLALAFTPITTGRRAPTKRCRS